jgi:hypothetical protein
MQRSVRNYCQGGRPPVGLFANFSDYLSEEEKTFEYNFGTCKYERALSHGRFCMQIETVVVVPLIILFAVVGRFDSKQWKVLLSLPYSLTLVSTSLVLFQ